MYTGNRSMMPFLKASKALTALLMYFSQSSALKTKIPNLQIQASTSRLDLKNGINALCSFFPQSSALKTKIPNLQIQASLICKFGIFVYS
ncbi:MAG: hypothetical protein E4H26_10000 [Flavobacteriales bacterium]|nr:MAG: hypothetical protein E4H26_10000 [Flavobacteriales bacterium]